MMLSKRIVSLWDMLEADAGRLFAAIAMTSAYSQILTTAKENNRIIRMPVRDIDDLRTAVSEMADAADGLKLSMTSEVAREVLGEIDRLEPDSNDQYLIPIASLPRLYGAVRRLQSAKYEAKSKIMLGLDPMGAALWKETEPFGAIVSASFPSATEDIAESAKCLAVERGTASVMHLMRATEVPLKALAKHLGIAQQNDWGSYIREIEANLATSLRVSGKRSPDELFYADAIASFDAVKRAWRNRTMHIEQTYTPERAKEIFAATKSFMNHLASKIHE
jgi:hypothetical protein